MAGIRVDIISIGTLSRNRLWNESAVVRTAHATTTLIRSGKRNVLIDPGLPPSAVAARLNERTGLKPDQVDTVFLTNFRAAHRGGLGAFAKAKVLMHEVEQQAARAQLESLRREIPGGDSDRQAVEAELRLLERIATPADRVAEQLDLFPLFGYTPGTCGLLVAGTTMTTLIAGDAVPTEEHFLAGQLLADTWNLEAAKEAMGEVYEIADAVVPGHDNWFLNPRMRGV